MTAGCMSILLERRGVLIVNPASASGATARRWPALAELLSKRGLRFEALLTERPLHIGELALRAVGGGAGWVICVGGDGSFNELVNGLAGQDGRIEASLPIGFIPSGTGLDLPRNLGLPIESFAAAEMLGSAIRRIDLGRVSWDDGSSRLFANMGGAGFDGEVASRAIPWRRYLPGKLPYAMGIVTSLPHFQERHMELVVEGDGATRRVAVQAKMVVATNGASFGGGMQLTPGAKMDDGLLDLFILGAVAPLELLASLPRVYQGQHLDHPEVTVLRVRRVRVSSPEDTPVQTDGEPVGMLPATFDVVPSAVSVLV